MRINGQRVFIVAGTRTPFLKMQKQAGDFSASELALGALKPLFQQYESLKSDIKEVVIGCAIPSSQEANIARLIALRAGLADTTSAFTVQRNCASGLQALDSAIGLLRTGQSEIILAGGTEAMSRAPLLYNAQMVRWFGGMQSAKKPLQKIQQLLKLRLDILNPVIALLEGLSDATLSLNMGQTAEELAYNFQIDRERMDLFAVESHQRAIAAQTTQSLVPLYSHQGVAYEQDDGVRSDASMERLAKLKPVFEKHGTVTAGNSSQISDGAAMLLLATESGLQKHHLKPLAEIKAVAWAGVKPLWMGLGPVHAMHEALKMAQLQMSDIDYFEINEAFAAQVLACQKAAGSAEYRKTYQLEGTGLDTIPADKLNVEGGAIAIGHPVGASGARLPLQMAHLLHRRQARLGMISLCIGGGQGGAMIVERVGA